MGSDGTSLVAALGPGGWELAAAGREAGGVALDGRLRVRVPAGVRHQLGLDGGVVVSLAVDRRRLVVWPAVRLDDVLGRS